MALSVRFQYQFISALHASEMQRAGTECFVNQQSVLVHAMLWRFMSQSQRRSLAA